MIRLYFDTNIYTYYKQGKHPGLFKTILKSKNDIFLICYSQAHLNDLHQDKSDEKFKDLKIIENFCTDNFLQYDYLEGRISNLLARPREAYDAFKPDDQSYETFMTDLFQIDDDKDFEEKFRKFFDNQIIDLGLSKHPKAKEAKEMYGRLGITKDQYTMSEWMKIVGRMMDTFSTDNKIIRDARRLSKQHLQVEKFNVNIDEVKFDENLSKTKIGKSFSDLLEEQLSHFQKDKSKVSIFDRFTTAFNLINFFGFDNERNKKVKFVNTQNDSQHSYYGTVCDIVVSEDEGFRQKSKFLYSFYDIDTEVLSLDEFENKIALILNSRIDSFENFLQLLKYDLDNNIIVGNNPSIKYSQTNFVIKTTHRYFHHFNRISRNVLYDDMSTYFILYYDSSRFNHYHFYKDYISVTNKVVKAFGSDDTFKSNFIDEDMRQVKSNAWLGRKWTFGDMIIRLLTNPDSKRINLQIGPLYLNSH